MFPYIPNTAEDEKKILDYLGLEKVDDLFSDIPEDLRLKNRLNINEPLSEMEVSTKITHTANKNISTEDSICFLGAGAYDHFIPSIIHHITSRSEFYTAYTPYQPEISQGTLQAIFEYQTMICNLTGMDVSNASMYDGASATAEACNMALDNCKGNSIVISKTVHPEVRRVVKTYMRFKNVEVIEIDFKDGCTDMELLKSKVNKDTLGVVVQNPNFFGVVEDYSEVSKIAHDNKALFIMNVDPISLGILKTPKEYGADIAIGEGQVLGNPLSFGGPYLGFMAVTKKLMRKMPGRIVGQTEDAHGKRAFVLTLQAREQHIRREKATSNICSNQALNALTATIYLSTLGKSGIKEVANQCTKKAYYAYNKFISTGKFRPVWNKPFFREFVLETDMDVSILNKELIKYGITGGYALEKSYPLCKNQILFCVTEKRTKEEIDYFAKLIEGGELL